MAVLKWLGGGIGALLVLAIAVVIGARFGDGPTAILPGGPLVAGELVSGPEPDWTFARDIAEMEFQLVEPPQSRTIWLQVHDKKLYVVSGYMNSAVGRIWKKWPAQALADDRAVIRIDGKRYERKLVRILDDRPLQWVIGMHTGDNRLDPRASPIHAKDHSGLAPAMVIAASIDFLVVQWHEARERREPGVACAWAMAYEGVGWLPVIS